MEIDLEKIDIIRERMGVSYAEAKAALEEANGDVVAALINLEKQAQKASWTEEFQVRGNEVVEKVKELVRQGNVTKIRVKREGQTIFELPVTIGAIGAALAPQLAVLGIVAGLITRCTVEIEKRKENGEQETETIEMEENIDKH